MDKPFLSIVIPTYNPREFLPRMLDSIARNECANEIEIIIADDCSEEPFDDVLKQFENLNIVTISNEKHCGFPRMGRQNGSEVAQGEWLTFADQDDYYLFNAIDAVKQLIEEQDVKNVLFCAIYKDDPEKKERVYEEPNKAWTHGKFIRKSFWDENDIHYDNLDKCEDTNIATKLQCILIEKNEPAGMFESPVYVWINRKDSLGHRNNGEFFIKTMSDYIKATTGVILQYLERNLDNKQLTDIYIKSVIISIYRIYFYLQNVIYNVNKDEIMKAILTLQPLFFKFKLLTGMKNEQLIIMTYSEWSKLYNDVRAEVLNDELIVEQMSFKDWVTAFLNSDDIIMAQ